MNPSTLPCFPPRPSRAARCGSTLLVALFTVAVLSMLAGAVLTSISSRYNSAYRSAAWNDALLAAETGIDTALADVAGLLPDVRANGSGLGVGYTQNADPFKLAQQTQLFSGGLLKTGTVLTFKTDPLVHGGEGGTTQRAEVTLEVKTLNQILNEGVDGMVKNVVGLVTGSGGDKVTLLQLRSRGIAQLPGGTVAGPSRQDNELWRASLLTDRFTGAAATAPSVSRQVEVTLRPVYPFESAVSSDDALLATDKNTVFDSFNSSLASASTNGEYDSAKRLTNGSVLANGANVVINGKVFGDVNTGGGSVPQDERLTGTVNNAFFAPLPSLKTPPLLNVLNVPIPLFLSLDLAAGPNELPAQYVFTGITSSGRLHITGGGDRLNTDAVIYVNGDLNGGIEVDAGVTAKVYVTGSVNTAASKLKNGSRRAANLQIYGVPATGTTPSIRINNDAALIASIYAPAHSVYLNGNYDLSGAVVAARFEMTGKMRLHYDEALALNVGPVLRYKIVNWREVLNQRPSPVIP